MYYATYKGIGESDVTAFETQEERDKWVNFQDQFSVDFHTTPENCVFEREALTDESIINAVITDETIPKVEDQYNPNQIWYLRSVKF